MLLKQARATITRYDMLTVPDRILVAVSGGPDSVALLHVLVELSGGMQLALTVAHLDHRLRGAESEGDRKFVEDLARTLGLRCLCGEEDVEALARREKRSLEEAGRVARRRFLREAARSADARRVALGHHRDDQAESVLMRLFSGGGRGGLAGIKPVTAGLFVRPFFDCSRSDILAFLGERGIPYRLDATNEDLRFPRNRIRRRVLPMLREEFNPRVTEAISRAADLLRDEDRYLEQRARRSLTRLTLEEMRAGAESMLMLGETKPKAERAVALDAAALSALPRPIGRRALRLALRRAGLRGRDLAMLRIDEILELATRAGSNASLSPGGGLWVRLEYGRLVIESAGPEPGSRDDSAPAGGRSRLPDSARRSVEPGQALALPGRSEIAGLDLRVDAHLFSIEAVAGVFRKAQPQQAYLDADLLGESVLVRPPRAGDRFHPLGAPGRRKLSDLFTDLKLPRAARRRALVIESGGDIAWVAGLRISHRFRVTGATRRVVLLELTSSPAAKDAFREGTAGRASEPPARPEAGLQAPSLPQDHAPQPAASRVLYTPEEIAAAVGRLADEVSIWMAGREILVLGILQGSFMFMADLVRLLSGQVRTGFLDRSGRPVAGDLPLDGARVLLVEDILDTGESLARILAQIRQAGPLEVRSCVLFDKPSGRKVAIEADHRGLLVPDRWVVGYGLDHQGALRNLPYLTWV